MISPERVGAFIEYVARPLVGDLKEILEKVEQLGIPVEAMKPVLLKVAAGILVCEVIKGITYVAVTYLICQTVLSALPLIR